MISIALVVLLTDNGKSPSSSDSRVGDDSADACMRGLGYLLAGITAGHNGTSISMGPKFRCLFISMGINVVWLLEREKLWFGCDEGLSMSIVSVTWTSLTLTLKHISFIMTPAFFFVFPSPTYHMLHAFGCSPKATHWITQRDVASQLVCISTFHYVGSPFLWFALNLLCLLSG